MELMLASIQGEKPRRKPRPVAVVLDYGQVVTFNSIRAAARYIDVSHVSLMQALDEGRTCFGMEVFYVNAQQNHRN